MTANIVSSPCVEGRSADRARGGTVAAGEESLRLAVERIAVLLEMHEMRRTRDLHVAPQPRCLEGIEQPARIDIAAQAVPLAADDRDGGLHEAGVVGERAGPGVEDVLERPARRLHRG